MKPELNVNGAYCPVDGTANSAPTIPDVIKDLGQNSQSNTLLGENPPLCECARVGKRPLSWVAWLGILSNAKEGSLLDRNNLEVSHHHIKFEETKQNIGFGPKGLFSEDVDRYNYRWGSECHDGTKVREAIRSVADLGKYNLFLNNCQNYLARVFGFIKNQ